MKKIIVALVILLAAGGFVWWSMGNSPVNPKDKTTKIFVVQKGESIKAIGNDLKEKGLIRDAFIFSLVVRQLGLQNKIQAGDFRLSPSLSTQQITTNLTKGTLDVWVTIPEGLRATEIAAILKDKLPNYDTSWIPSLTSEEGYLFPDTYLFARDATIQTIVSTMENNFNQKYEVAKTNQTNSLTEKQVVTLASIVQREAITPHDMQYVASVLENRLDIGMALGSDVTVEYALGYQTGEKTWWKKDLNADDLVINSPYNTRRFAGLPPTPISNPGLTALEAVLTPPKSDYLYFIADSKGVVHFATTLEQHNANIKKYGL